MTSCIKFLCCGCFGDNKEPSLKREDHKSPLLNSTTQIKPHNSYQHGASSLTASPQQEDMQQTGEKVDQLVGSEHIASLESGYLTPTHSQPSSRNLTPHSSPGLSSSADDVAFNWEEHATDHKSPAKRPPNLDN